MLNAMKKACALGILALACGSAAGCFYAGIATAPDGTLYIARNDMFLAGLLRKMYICKPAGATMACIETTAP